MLGVASAFAAGALAKIFLEGSDEVLAAAVVVVAALEKGFCGAGVKEKALLGFSLVDGQETPLDASVGLKGDEKKFGCVVLFDGADVTGVFSDAGVGEKGLAVAPKLNFGTVSAPVDSLLFLFCPKGVNPDEPEPNGVAEKLKLTDGGGAAAADEPVPFRPLPKLGVEAPNTGVDSDMVVVARAPPLPNEVDVAPNEPDQPFCCEAPKVKDDGWGACCCGCCCCNNDIELPGPGELGPLALPRRPLLPEAILRFAICCAVARLGWMPPPPAAAPSSMRPAPPSPSFVS